MTSRLDRLFVLLESGAGAATRRAAARQLGEIQKAHPEELHRLLGRLMKHLRSPAWETRVAASQAVEAILSKVPEWRPAPVSGTKEEPEEEVGRLRCETFDIEQVLQHGAHLMGSEGREYEMEEDPAADLKELLAKQRQQLNVQLGLDVAGKLGVDISAMYSTEDLCLTTVKPVKSEAPRRPVLELCPPSKQLSSREMNLAKRKARQQFCKQKSCDEGPSAPSTPVPSTPEPDRKKIKLEPADEFTFESAPTPDLSGTWGYSARWPLEGWSGALQAQLFGAAWEARHGSAMALRELLKARVAVTAGCTTGMTEQQAQLFGAAWEARHGSAMALRELLKARVAVTAGCSTGMTEQQMEDAHQEWLEDMALRLLCVLALDRFGDFVSDQVVAPVRETSAQTLGVALAQLREGRVRRVADLLAGLARQRQWEARHGALLGFKYLLAARQDVACASGALEHLMAGLDDSAEDVSSVAAGALAPSAAALASARPQALSAVVARLWSLLRDQDDLAAPAQAYMALLAALMALPQAARLLHPIDLSDVLPRLWPYLDHSTSSVRKATLQTLRTLTRPLITTVPTANGNSNGNQVTKSDAPPAVTKSDALSTVTKSDALPTVTKNDAWSAVTKSDAPIVTKSDAPYKVTNSNTSEKSSEVMSSDSNSSDVNSNSAKASENSETDKYLSWTPELLQEAMRHVYQRVLFEHVHEIQDIAVQVWENLLQHAPLSTILVAACPLLATWMCLAMQPARLAVDPSLLVLAPPKERRTRSNSQSEETPPAEARPNQKWFVGGSESQSTDVRDTNVTRARCLAAHVLGHLSCYLVQPAPGIEYKTSDESPIDCYVKVMVVYLRAGSALQRLVASLVVSSWAKHTREKGLFPPNIRLQTTESTAPDDIAKLAPPLLSTTLHMALNQALYYDEVALNCNRILQEARDLHAMMKHYKLPLDGEEFHIVRLEQVQHLTTASKPLVAAMKSKRVATTLEERRASLHSAVSLCAGEQNTLNISVQAALAGACANLHSLPEKLNPVVRPLMESIKKEPSEELQTLSADALAALLEQLSGKEPCPNNKVLVNLKAFLRCDPEFTPRLNLETGEENGDNSGSDHSGSESVGARDARAIGPKVDTFSGILSLSLAARALDRNRAPRRGRPPQQQTNDAPRRGRPPSIAHVPVHVNAHVADAQVPVDETQRALCISRRGARLALSRLAAHCGARLPERLPKLWEFLTQPFAALMTDAELDDMSIEEAEELISRLQVFEVACAHVAAGAWATAGAGEGEGERTENGVSCGVSALFGRACALLTRSPYTAVRHMAARALAAMAREDPVALMHTVIDELVPALSDVRSERVRCGAAEAMALVVDALQLRLVPYIVLLVIPLLGRMSDHCEAVRVMSTRCFASLIQLMPLDGAVAEPEGLSPELRARRARDKHFLDQLFNPKSIKDYKIPVPVSAELRSYQQAGVNWLRFLNEYKLHGVLCDDMGLGKTLQSVVVVAGSHWERSQQGLPELPSLVVCPPTLTGHWVFEVNKFIPNKFLRTLQYVGPPVERERLRLQVKHYNLIVASYEIVRKDIEFFSRIKWNYCVLDEGHVIKNGKTKAFKAIKQLVASHRLILSGTPIQNNVLELWSLFDFLMPGLLGSERQFTARYSRPILAARDPKATPHQLQAGAMACEALHRQVLPFLLRRVKEDVLKELPPKITQDYYCELSPLQRRLYEHFSRDHLPPHLASASHTHAFHALRYLQNVCNHPKLVLTAEHPEAATVRELLQQQRSALDDIHHSAKLPALKQLLLDCGIGVANTESGAEVVVSQHRALVFCQLKKMLDIVEHDLLRRHLPGVTYLRLDGSLPPQQRHAIVTRFNSDVSIDLLLLTTQVGGLGLNLTGADTVIFVEHDWNPMKDLQAMDRAHRIGQKKVVNVYRLITRDTLEEKIMGLQKFKLGTANTVISSENAAMETMGTDQLLDLFQLGDGPTTSAGGLPTSSGQTGGLLPDLWDDKQYEEEYDMSSFIAGLNKMNTESA